jgi:L-amino acid N-acyltransferase YncA
VGDKTDNILFLRPGSAGDQHQAEALAERSLSFELEAPSVEEMRLRIESALERMPWLVAEDRSGAISGYAYAGKHRERPAHQWSADTPAYVRQDVRATGVGSTGPRSKS